MRLAALRIGFARMECLLVSYLYRPLARVSGRRSGSHSSSSALNGVLILQVVAVITGELLPRARDSCAGPRADLSQGAKAQWQLQK